MVLASDLNSPQRKPNFQGYLIYLREDTKNAQYSVLPTRIGPTIKITIDDAKWLPYVGDISGFVSTGASPVLGTISIAVSNVVKNVNSFTE